MSGDEEVELDYHYLTNNALKGVVRDVLVLTQELGTAPGEHHFYVEFLTRAEGVSIPDRLLNDYPERMTIVLQHQFEALEVEDDRFSVTLYFKRQPARLIVPFEAVTSFADPSVQFGLRFDALPQGAPDVDGDSNGATASGDDAAGDTKDSASDDTVHRITPQGTAKATSKNAKKPPKKSSAATDKADKADKAGNAATGSDDQPADENGDGEAADETAGADIVSLDAFRKK